MRISSRIKQLKAPATLAINARVQALKKQGREIISLAVGEPDFNTPEHVGLAAEQAIKSGFTRYTPVAGIAELREAVAGYFNHFYSVAARPEHTIVANGGKQVLYNLLQCLIDPGDQVIVPSPYWVSYPYMVELAGGEVVYVPARAENGFKITPADLEKVLTGRSRVLLLNSPSNPTGAHYRQEELDALAGLAMDHGLFIISDEIYDQLIYPPAEPSSLAPCWEKHPDRVGVVNGLAKSFAMTGWRVGYGLAHPDLIKAMANIQGHSTSNICSIAQKAALAALTGPWDFVAHMRDSLMRRRDLALEVVSQWPAVFCPKPDGAFYLFVQVSELYTADIPDSTALCGRILEEAGVGLVPGVEFGDDSCIRLSYAVDEPTLLSALDKIERVLRRL